MSFDVFKIVLTYLLTYLPGTRVRTVRDGPVRVPGTYRTAPQVGKLRRRRKIFGNHPKFYRHIGFLSERAGGK